MEKDRELEPPFDSTEEEAEYWDTHSPLDLASEPEAQEVRARGGKDRPITIRLDTRTRSRLNRLAAAQGLGPSTFARSVLVAALERQAQQPKGINLLDLKEMMEQVFPEALADRAERLMQAVAIGDTDSPSLFILDNDQLNELQDIGLQAVAHILSCFGAEVVTPDHERYEAVRALVHAGAAKGEAGQ